MNAVCHKVGGLYSAESLKFMGRRGEGQTFSRDSPLMLATGTRD
jgi:hypothetical protein